MVGKGQPPKKPEDKRNVTRVMLSPKEKAKIENARQIEFSEKPFSTYIREIALNHAENVGG